MTANVVRDLQISYDLPASGIADEITREKITNVLNPPYHNGDRGKGIIELKEKLVLLGFASWEDPSQYFGSHTITVLNQIGRASCREIGVKSGVYGGRRVE